MSRFACSPGESPLPSADLLNSVPNAEAFVVAALKRMSGKMPKFDDDILFLDIETHGSELRWDMPREEFVRLCQYAWGEGPVQTTTSLTEFLDLIGRARLVVAHNGHAFDFSVLCGDSAWIWLLRRNCSTHGCLPRSIFQHPTPT